jgi:hypothetical protein
MAGASGDAKTSSGGRALGLVPVLVAVVFAALLLPRSAPPDGVPLPDIDHVALRRQSDADRALAASARAAGLPDDLRLLGSALRDYHLVEVGSDVRLDAERVRRAIDASFQDALASAGTDGLLRLRAVQLDEFLAALRDFERTGAEPKDLVEVGGPFVRRLRQEGWAGARTVLPDETVRRVMFKQMWNAVLGLDGDPTSPLALSTDELRALYAFYLEHPHPADQARFYIDSARKAAKDKAACAALDEGERIAIEAWRLDRIERLALVDPGYPADYARGVAHYRKGEYRAAAESFQSWLDAHPRGAWSLRAQDHLKASLEAARVDR